MERLRAFLDADGGFAWMQIAGVGGQGKSRLGWELTLWAREHGWRAGLLERADLKDFAEHWSTWQPRQPHLLVLDYVIGREAAIKPVLQTLAGRAAELGKPVRLLLLERQRWDRGGLGGLARAGEAGSGSDPGHGPGLSVGLGFDGRAEWFLALAERPDGNDPRLESTRFEDGLLELTQLSDTDLVAIVHKVAALTRARLSGDTSEAAENRPSVAAMGRLMQRILNSLRRSAKPSGNERSDLRASASEITLSDAAIVERLRHIDSDGRPLYAYFLGQALADGTDPAADATGPGWRRDDLLNATLERDRNTRWRECLGADAPCLGDNSPAERLAVIATMASGLDCAAAARQGLIDHADADTRRRALVLADGPLGTGVGGPSQIIPPLMPDLLGAWLVLSACRQGLNTAELLDIAWRLAPEQTAALLQRVSQDFPEHAVATEMLTQAPPDEPAAQALAGVAAAVLSNLFKARQAFPQPVMAALMRAAEGGDPKAMGNLGYCYMTGQGVEPDPAQALAWYRKGAEAGDETARRNLRALETAQGLLAEDGGPDSEAEAWARTTTARLNTVEWRDGPPLSGDWQELAGADALPMLAVVHGPLLALGLGEALDGLQIQRLRRSALACYPNCHLLDLQLQLPGQGTPLLCSALVTAGGAALLDGTSPLLHAINLRLLRLGDDEVTGAYLRFFCRFVRSGEGPFQIIDDLGDIRLNTTSPASIAESLLSPIKPLQALDGDLETDGWLRFEACVLFGNGVFRAIFKVYKTGMVEMEGDEKIAADLPIQTRRYDGIFRTPLLDPAAG